MPPKPKRLPNPFLHHLKNSRQLLEDFLYQYLPQLTGMGAISRINLYTWCNSRWSLTPDGMQGLPYMVLDALRLQRQHLLQHKLSLKPLSLTLLGAKEDAVLQKAFSQLQESSNQSHTARVTILQLPWQEQLKQLQAQLLRQPATERNLLILNPLELSLPRLPEFLQLLPRKVDVLMLLPTAALLHAGGVVQKIAPAPAIVALSNWLAPFLNKQEGEAAEIPPTAAELIQQLKAGISEQNTHFILHHPLAAEAAPVLMMGFTTDALIMEKMLQARQQLTLLAQQQLQAGNQLGLFGACIGTAETRTPVTEHLLQLFALQPEWNNQSLYKALLQQEILPPEATKEILALLAAGKLEMLDEKKKKQPVTASIALSHTAYKLPAPARYFRLKQ